MTKFRYVAETTISRVEERHARHHVSGTGDAAVMEEVSTGWWLVTAAPQPYAFCVGNEKPPHAEGDVVRLVLEV